MAAISYFFYKLLLADFSVTFYVYTKELMPTTSARVSTECTIANTIRFMEHYYNNDTVTVILIYYEAMKVKSVILKLENDLDSLYERQVSFSCMSFHVAQ